MSENVENLKEFIVHNLPHGSGINYDWLCEEDKELPIYDDFNCLIGIEFIFSNNFDTITENGMYCCEIPFTIKVTGKFSSDGNIIFSTEFKKFACNYFECENCGGADYSLEDYLEQLFFDCGFSLGIEE